MEIGSPAQCLVELLTIGLDRLLNEFGFALERLIKLIFPLPDPLELLVQFIFSF